MPANEITANIDDQLHMPQIATVVALVAVSISNSGSEL